MATAVDAVFDTAELLEAILSELEPKDLLLSQRVSKTWKLAIAASRGLQEELFLRPIKVVQAANIVLYAGMSVSTSLGTYF
ncbi:unnamed protein product [Cercospora beticola]|nr:unnamed protein product [Cercospora beticola]